MSTSALAKGGRIGVAFGQTHSKEKGVMGRLLLMRDIPGRHIIMQAQKGIRESVGGGLGGNRHATPITHAAAHHNTLTQTPWRLLFFIWRGRSLSLSFSQEPNQPTHPTHHTYCIPIRTASPNRQFSIKSFLSASH